MYLPDFSRTSMFDSILLNGGRIRRTIRGQTKNQRNVTIFLITQENKMHDMIYCYTLGINKYCKIHEGFSAKYSARFRKFVIK